LLPAPTSWSSLSKGKIPPNTHGFDDQELPERWPIQFTNAHWAAVLHGLPEGEYTFRCRTMAQPQPLPCIVTLGKSDPPWVTPAGCDREVKATCIVTLGKSDPPWVTPAGCDREVKATRIVTLGKSDPPWVTPAGCDREVKATSSQLQLKPWQCRATPKP